ncbi:uncharacterized protein LOC129951074 [Eupeodes corollae]|uniref:uncharacterized protein LOC129951074 n=1 Tax=Eupeodes corollae TaxID=290404 RepID=UPI0024921451|nr:uncharacterized protein LOC129951074 [Eupeodes corollae]
MPEVKLKLLSGGTIILADCVGYESELFVPAIINNRIVLQNAVVSRDCRPWNSIESGKTLVKNNSSTNYVKKLSINRQVPLANSTPTPAVKTCKESISITVNSNPNYTRKPTLLYNSSEMKFPSELTIEPLYKSQNTKLPNKIARVTPTAFTNLPQSAEFTRSMMNRLPTPDIVRRAPIQCQNDTIPLPEHPQITGLKIVRLHRVNTPNTPKNLAKIVRSKTPLANSASPRVLRNLTNLSSFGSPPTMSRTKEINSFDCATPNQSFLANKIKTPDTTTKWRKCITPKRTYIRHSNGQKPINKTIKLEPLQTTKNGKFVESYRLPTKIKNPIIIKRRKLIIDNDVKITPRKFKKQLTNTEDLNRSKKFNLPKSRRHYHISHMTAFDLLTNSGFHPRIGNQLNTLFRQGCVNKHAETILKYKQLTNDLPLLRVCKYNSM